MTPLSNWGTGTIAFIGDTDGLPPIPPEDPVEEDSDYVQEGVNISFGGNGVRNPGSGFFNGARNFSIVGGTFSTYPADAHVFHSWSSPGPAMNASSGSHRAPRRQSQAAMDLEAEWDGSRVDASSSNGNVQVAYDDEDAFGSSGKWKSDLPSRRNGSGGGGGVRSNFVIAAGDWPSWTGFMGAWA